MTRLFRALSKRLPRFFPDALRREDGTATMEFVLCIPVIMMVFMASFESALLMTRSIMLEHSVDMTIRDLRLGHFTSPSNVFLKQQICSHTVIFADCAANMKIELDRIDTTTWAIPPAPNECIDRQTHFDPVVIPIPGEPNDLMLIRVCIIVQAMFPTSGMGLHLNLDPGGGYALVARSAFAVEPS
ncbi:MAG: TadE/TadG family type IV pilus assembly protein [Paracoccaceae bacterium]